MSFPFVSATHAHLRYRLLVAMGLTPACASGHLDQPPSVVRDPRDAAIPRDSDVEVDAYVTVDASAPTTPHVPDANVCPSGNGAPAEQCLTRAALEELVTWGGGMLRPQQPLRTPEQVQALFLADGCLPPEYVQNGCCVPALGPGTAQGDSCCYAFCQGTCCGRPFLVNGGARSARAVVRSDWMSGAAHARVETAEVRELLADAWRADALLEHASIAAFARFALELLAFAAPAELVSAALVAGADEVAHAELCFALAARYAGIPVGPGALAMTGVAPAATLRESVLCAVREGCIGETLAAARASAQRDVATDPAVRDVLTRIAEDETRHAELAYRFVAWAVREDRSLVHDIAMLVREEARAVPLVPTAMRAPELERALADAGRLSGRDEDRVRRDTFASVITPCFAQLLEGSRIVHARHDARSFRRRASSLAGPRSRSAASAARASPRRCATRRPAH